LENRNRIREIRKSLKMTGTAVAEQIGISPQLYYDIERGRRRLNSKVAGQLSDILKVTTDYILQKTDINLYDPDSEIELTSKQVKIVIDGKLVNKEEMDFIVAYIRTTRQVKEERK